jgi:NADH:ubiquinone oxidoreductase subunit B-like Fe-S oxidoreductase
MNRPLHVCTHGCVISVTSIAHSIQKLANKIKNLKKAFTQLQKTSKQDSNLSHSESEEEDTHFQFDDEFQFTEMKVHLTDGNQI